MTSRNKAILLLILLINASLVYCQTYQGAGGSMPDDGRSQGVVNIRVHNQLGQPVLAKSIKIHWMSPRCQKDSTSSISMIKGEPSEPSKICIQHH